MTGTSLREADVTGLASCSRSLVEAAGALVASRASAAESVAIGAAGAVLGGDIMLLRSLALEVSRHEAAYTAGAAEVGALGMEVARAALSLLAASAADLATEALRTPIVAATRSPDAVRGESYTLATKAGVSVAAGAGAMGHTSVVTKWTNPDGTVVWTVDTETIGEVGPSVTQPGITINGAASASALEGILEHRQYVVATEANALALATRLAMQDTKVSGSPGVEDARWLASYIPGAAGELPGLLGALPAPATTGFGFAEDVAASLPGLGEVGLHARAIRTDLGHGVVREELGLTADGVLPAALIAALPIGSGAASLQITALRRNGHVETVTLTTTVEHQHGTGVPTIDRSVGTSDADSATVELVVGRDIDAEQADVLLLARHPEHLLDLRHISIDPNQVVHTHTHNEHVGLEGSAQAVLLGGSASLDLTRSTPTR